MPWRWRRSTNERITIGVTLALFLFVSFDRKGSILSDKRCLEANVYQSKSLSDLFGFSFSYSFPSFFCLALLSIFRATVDQKQWLILKWQRKQTRFTTKAKNSIMVIVLQIKEYLNVLLMFIFPTLDHRYRIVIDLNKQIQCVFDYNKYIEG